MPQSATTVSVRILNEFVCLVTLARPDAANALNTQMGRELAAAVTAIPKQCRVVVITGEGKHFCAGADLKERTGMDEAQWKTQHDALEAALQSVLDCPVPVIAAVNGSAFGGGLELALAADFIHAADSAQFGLTETTLGIMPGLGGAQSLSRAVGERRAKELLFKGQRFTAQEAHEWGMVNALFPAERLLDEALACAEIIAQNAPLAVGACKRSLRRHGHLPFAEAWHNELIDYNTLIKTDDRREGIAAFNEKRKPDFTGS